MIKKFIDVKTEKIAYLDEGKGDIILFIHGNMAAALHYHKMIDALKGQYRCVAIDMSGFGDSSYNTRKINLKQYAQEVFDFATALGISSAHVVGWSTGGGVALELAAKEPQFVKSIFSIEGASHRSYPVYKKDENNKAIMGCAYESIEAMAEDKPQSQYASYLLANKLVPEMTKLWNSLFYTANKPDEEENLMLINETLKQRNIVDIYWALSNLNMSNEPTAYKAIGDNTIKDVKCPCVFTTGDKDILVIRSMIEDNMRALKDTATLIEYTDCGHSPMVDVPEQMIEDLRNFITSL